MGKPWKRSAEKEAYWQLVMTEWRESGLTGREFCKKKGLSEHQYYAWKRELRIRAKEAELNIAVAKNENGPEPAQPIFIPLSVSSVPAEGTRSLASIEIIIRDCCIRVQPDFDSETLSRVLAVLDGYAEVAE